MILPKVESKPEPIEICNEDDKIEKEEQERGPEESQ